MVEHFPETPVQSAMNPFLRTLTRCIPSTLTLLSFFAAGPAAVGMQIFPANVQNNTSVPLEICVERVQTGLGMATTTNESKVTIQPGQHAPVMLMGGAFGMGASSTSKITITQVVASGAKPIAPALVLKDPAVGLEREFVVSVDTKTGQFKFEAAPAEATTGASAPIRRSPAPPEDNSPTASKMYIVSLDPKTDAKVETARLEKAYDFKAAYVYTAAAHGFAASLGQEQVKKLRAESTVLMIQPSRVVHLDSPGGPQ
jgi:hypothetical protein